MSDRKHKNDKYDTSQYDSSPDGQPVFAFLFKFYIWFNSTSCMVVNMVLMQILDGATSHFFSNFVLSMFVTICCFFIFILFVWNACLMSG